MAYELRDSNYPHWRGSRFGTLERALKALGEAIGPKGRWSVVDRATGETVATNGDQF